MSELSPTLTEIVAGVWAAAARTLSGGSGGAPVAAPASDADIYRTVFQGGTARLLAHVCLDGRDIQIADAESVAYSIFLLDAEAAGDRTPIDGHTAVALEPEDVLFDALQSDAQASGYNFRHLVPIDEHPAFAEAGRTYLVEYVITPPAVQKVMVRFRVSAI